MYIKKALLVLASQLIAISNASAATNAPDAMSSFQNLMPILLIFAVVYFMMVRPQQKKMKQHNAALEQLKEGNRVIICGGIKGCISSTAKETCTVEIAQGVKVNILKSAITTIEQPNNHNGKKNNKNHKADHHNAAKSSNKNDNASSKNSEESQSSPKPTRKRRPQRKIQKNDSNDRAAEKTEA